LYRDLAKSQNKSIPFIPKDTSKLSGSGGAPPDFTKINEMMAQYEYDHLASLTNV
jgi:hypothetical protein